MELMLPHLVEMMVGPELADKWLRAADKVGERQGHRVNRPLSQKRIALLVHSMNEDEFKPVGDLIRIAHDPEIGDYAVDGQHRLHALLQANVRLPLLVWLNFPPALFPYLDGRGPRRPADILAIDGETNTVRLAAMATWVYKLERKILDTRATLDAYEIKNLVYRHPRLRHWSAILSNNSNLRRAPVGATLYWLERTGDMRFEAFANGLITGENLHTGDPVLVLRNRVLEKRKEDEGAPTVVMMFSAWEYYLAGGTIRSLSAAASPKWPVPGPYLMK